jgi:hypothetical protein
MSLPKLQTVALTCDHEFLDAPLLLYHGTPYFFENFQDSRLTSLGLHFGCREQADWRVRHFREKRIIHSYLRTAQVLDIRGQGDPGWENAAMTWVHLHLSTLGRGPKGISAADLAHVGLETDMMAATRSRASKEENARLNNALRTLLRQKGYGVVLYSNHNEPRDGIARDAYCVLSLDLVVPVSYEDIFDPCL